MGLSFFYIYFRAGSINIFLLENMKFHFLSDLYYYILYELLFFISKVADLNISWFYSKLANIFYMLVRMRAWVKPAKMSLKFYTCILGERELDIFHVNIYIDVQCLRKIDIFS